MKLAMWVAGDEPAPAAVPVRRLDWIRMGVYPVLACFVLVVVWWIAHPERLPGSITGNDKNLDSRLYGAHRNYCFNRDGTYVQTDEGRIIVDRGKWWVAKEKLVMVSETWESGRRQMIKASRERYETKGQPGYHDPAFLERINLLESDLATNCEHVHTYEFVEGHLYINGNRE